MDGINYFNIYMATNTGFLDINGTDLINAYFTNSNSTFTGVNVFNNGTTRGLISYNQTIIDSASTITYISTNVPNCILANGLNMESSYEWCAKWIHSKFSSQ